MGAGADNRQRGQQRQLPGTTAEYALQCAGQALLCQR